MTSSSSLPSQADVLISSPHDDNNDKPVSATGAVLSISNPIIHNNNDSSSSIHNINPTTTTITTTTTTSPEAAGILRGASRTFLQSLAKRTNQIRKTVVKSATTTTTTTTKASPISSTINSLKGEKILLEKLFSWKFSNPFKKTTMKPKTVAQVSDKMAMGMDLVHIALEQQQQPEESSSSSSKRTNHKNHHTNSTITLMNHCVSSSCTNLSSSSSSSSSLTAIPKKTSSPIITSVDSIQRNPSKVIIDLESLSTTTTTATTLKTLTLWKQYRETALNITYNLTKNVILGSIAFESYDYGIHSLEEGEEKKKMMIHSSSNNPTTSMTTTMTTTTITQHFFIGGLSGSIYSLSLSSWENISTFTSNIIRTHYPSISSSQSLVSSSSMMSPSPYITSPLMYSLLSNTISHSILYGSYEGLKRFLFHTINHPSHYYYHHPHTHHVLNKNKNHNGDHNNDQDDEDETMNNTSMSLLSRSIPIYGIAGGIAGILHHIISHSMEQPWKEQGNTSHIILQQQQVSSSILSLLQKIKIKNRLLYLVETVKVSIPNTKSIFFTFLSHAIGFIAFECGKEIMT